MQPHWLESFRISEVIRTLRAGLHRTTLTLQKQLSPNPNVCPKNPEKAHGRQKEDDDDPFFDDDSDDEPVGRVNKPKKKSNFSSDGPSPSKYDTALPPPSRDEHKPRWEQDERRDPPPPRPRASIFAEPPRPSALRGRSPPKTRGAARGGEPGAGP